MKLRRTWNLGYAAGYLQGRQDDRTVLVPLIRALIDAVKANELQVSSNDLGNAIDELEDALAR